MTKPRLKSPPLLFMLILAVSGCQSDDGDACSIGGLGAVTSYRVLAPGCADPEYCGEDYLFASSGDATVIEVQGGPSNSYALTLHFARDATDVTIDLRLPENVPLPVAAGDVVEGQVQITTALWQEIRVTLRAPDGSLLLELVDTSLQSGASASTCDSAARECGSVGYPTLTVGHPEDDPTIALGPTAELRQGGSATLTWNDTTYTVYMIQAWIYTDPLCADEPPGQLRSILTRRFDP